MKNGEIGGTCIATDEKIAEMDCCPCICEDEDDEYCLGKDCGWYTDVED